MKVIVAAAGTGGHINPAIAIANKIKEKEPDSEIVFIGTPRGLENDLVPRAGYELKTIDVYGIKRKLDLDNIKRLYKTIKSIKDVEKIIKDFKPDVMIGTGGYICVSVGLAAHKKNIPIVLHESNAFPGVAVKLLAKESARVLLGFEVAKERIDKKAKIVVTGTPTKITNNRLTESEKAKIKSNLGLKENVPTVLVFGGSQGAQTINKTIIGIIENKLNKRYQILWAAGKKNYEEIKEALKAKGLNIDSLENAKIMPYIYNMQEAMEISDLIVSRSGAMTITEISNLGKPSILIPLPNVSQDHQTYNAKVLENVGAAKIIKNDELKKENLNEEIEKIIKNPELMHKMEEKAISKSVKNVQEKIYAEIKKIVKGGK